MPWQRFLQTKKNDINALHEGIEVPTTNYHPFFLFLSILPHFAIIPPKKDNPIVKKLKTYTKHSQFTKMKVQGNENEKRKRKGHIG